MKNFTCATLIALLLSPAVFSQTQNGTARNTPAAGTINQSSNNRLMLLSPADGKTFNSTDGSKPVLFRWTAGSQKPGEQITYRLRVWQLMQGQNGTQAMKNNQPVITKDVTNLTQTTVSNLYTGPCKPPYLCDFIWSVEAILTEDNAGATNGTAVAYTFKFDQAITKANGDPVHGVDVKLGVKN